MTDVRRMVAFDAHKATIAVAVCEEDGAPPAFYGTIPNEAMSVRRLIDKLGGKRVELEVAYEAGPTGFTLYRQLTRMGVRCSVVAPSLIPRRSGDRVKTDRRDALMLARLMRSGDLTAIWIPDEAHEALRDLVRAREDAKQDQLRARHRLSKFLLRKEMAPPPKTGAWGRKHWDWMGGVKFEHRADEVVFRDYVDVVKAAAERIKRLEADLLGCAQESPQLPFIAALQAYRGIAFLTAVTIVAEVGDMRRFANARQFMAYIGLVPSEYSSGQSTHRGAITHTGNSHLRHVLVESAHHARHAPNANSAAKQRQAGVPADIVDMAWKAQERLHRRYRNLAPRIGRQKAVTAVGRELAGFVWALGWRMTGEVAA